MASSASGAQSGTDVLTDAANNPILALLAVGHTGFDSFFSCRFAANQQNSRTGNGHQRQRSRFGDCT